MIYSVTFNPALDVSGVVESLIPNEKNYVKDELQTAGGNGINAGIIASRLKSKVLLTGFLGGPNGEVISKLLEMTKIPLKFVSIIGATRMNLTISNKSDHLQTRLSFAGPKITSKEFRQLEKVLNNINSHDIVILGGSLPSGITPALVRGLIRIIKKKDAFCMVDMPGDILREVIPAKPDFIKPNLTEFQMLVNKKVTSIEETLPYLKKVLKNVPLICLSSIEGGALLINEREAVWGKIPPVKIFSTVGAGDSMVGAIASELQSINQLNLKQLLRSGLAASCATLTEKGLTLGSAKAMINYRKKIILKKIF
jgi:1-phosphofructokinase family hexose kinase